MAAETPIQPRLARTFQASFVGDQTHVELGPAWTNLFSSTEPAMTESPQSQLPLSNTAGEAFSVSRYLFALPETPVLDVADRWANISYQLSDSLRHLEAVVARATQAWMQWDELLARILSNFTAAAAALSEKVASTHLELGARSVLPIDWIEGQHPVETRREPASLSLDLRPQADWRLGHTPDAFDLFKELGQSLSASDDEVALAVGVGRTTPYTWHRDKRVPKAKTLRKLYQLHSTVSAIGQHLSDADFVLWLHADNGRRRQALLRGDWAAIQRDIDDVVFGSHARPLPQPGTWIPTDGSEEGG